MLADPFNLHWLSKRSADLARKFQMETWSRARQVFCVTNLQEQNFWRASQAVKLGWMLIVRSWNNRDLNHFIHNSPSYLIWLQKNRGVYARERTNFGAQTIMLKASVVHCQAKRATKYIRLKKWPCTLNSQAARLKNSSFSLWSLCCFLRSRFRRSNRTFSSRYITSGWTKLHLLALSAGKDKKILSLVPTILKIQICLHFLGQFREAKPSVCARAYFTREDWAHPHGRAGARINGLM